MDAEGIAVVALHAVGPPDGAEVVIADEPAAAGSIAVPDGIGPGDGASVISY